MTGRVYRSWHCRCCGGEYVRRRTDRMAWHCLTCGVEMVAARTPKEPRLCRHRRAIAKYEKWKERYHARPRDRSGHILSPSAKTRAAWAAVRTAKRRDSLLRRANVFLQTLLTETREEQPDRYRRTLVLDHGAVRERRERGGMRSWPIIRYQHLTGLWGEYRRAIMANRYEIVLDPRVPDLDHLRATLVHEVLHLLDDDAGIVGEHDRLWRERLAEMYRRFPPNEHRVRGKRAALVIYDTIS